MLRVSTCSAERLWEMSWLIGKWRADWSCSHPEDSRGCVSGSAPEECMQWVSVEVCSCETLMDTLDNFSRQTRRFDWDAHQVTSEFHIWFINLCCCCLFLGGGVCVGVCGLRCKRDSVSFSLYPGMSATRLLRVWIWITSLVWGVEHFP